MTPRSARWQLGLLCGSALLGVLVLMPAPALLADLQQPGRWVGRVGADRAALQCVSALGWVLSCWTAVALLCCVLGNLRLPVPRVAPASLRRLVLTATGAAIVLSPAVAGAATVGSAASTAAPTMHQSTAPAWPTDDPVPTPAWPTGSSAGQSKPSHPEHAKPRHPSPSPTSSPTSSPASSPTSRAPAPAEAPASSHSTTVVVRPGDTLWTITAAHLAGHPSAGQVARAWPAWFSANRVVIGDDPDLIQPGQHLHVPDPTVTTHQGEQP